MLRVRPTGPSRPFRQLDDDARTVNECKRAVVEVQDVAARRNAVVREVRQHGAYVCDSEAHVVEANAGQRAGTFVGGGDRTVEPQELNFLVYRCTLEYQG